MLSPVLETLTWWHFRGCLHDLAIWCAGLIIQRLVSDSDSVLIQISVSINMQKLSLDQEEQPESRTSYHSAPHRLRSRLQNASDRTGLWAV